MTIPFSYAKVRSPFPYPRNFYKQTSESDSSKTNGSCGSSESWSWSSPVLKNFATRFLNSISETSSSIGSLFSPGTPDASLLNTPTNDLTTLGKIHDKERPALTPFCRELIPKLPFCEEYDGVNMRRTKTISESIIQILESRKEREDIQSRESSLSGVSEENLETTAFDRFQITRDLNEASKQLTCPNLEDSSADDTMSTYDSSLRKLSRSLMQSKRSVWANKFKISKVPSIEYLHLSGERGIEEATIDLKVKYNIDSETLEITIVRVEDITDLRDNNKLINSFVQISLYQRRGQKQKTRTAKLCRDATFNQTFKFENVTQKWFHVECLHLQLFRKKRFKNVCLGETRVWIDDLELFFRDYASITERFNSCY